MSVWSRLKHLALRDVGVILRGGADTLSLEQLEDLLLQSDFGVEVTATLVGELKRRAELGQIKTPGEFTSALTAEVERGLLEGKSDTTLATAPSPPTVIVVLGVNGAGKTTFIGKLAHRLRAQGRRVLVAAADTFRAGAADQLKVWAGRAGAEFVDGASASDPAAVAFTAIDAAVARGSDVVIVDTAGRLHTSDALMEELRKVIRVVAKRIPGAPHESLLVLDGTTGQNAVAQARTFAAAVPVTGLVLTKLDGTAKGGVVLAAHRAIDAPVKFVGLGESIEDLEPFDAAKFARGLVA